MLAAGRGWLPPRNRAWRQDGAVDAGAGSGSHRPRRTPLPPSWRAGMPAAILPTLAHRLCAERAAPPARDAASRHRPARVIAVRRGRGRAEGAAQVGSVDPVYLICGWPALGRMEESARARCCICDKWERDPSQMIFHALRHLHAAPCRAAGEAQLVLVLPGWWWDAAPCGDWMLAWAPAGCSRAALAIQFGLLFSQRHM